MPLNLDIPNPFSQMDEVERRNLFFSVLSGIFFFSAWWIVIDAAAQYPSNQDFNHAYHVCGVIATIALFMINSISSNQINGEGITEGCLGVMGSRIWFFVGLMLSFGSIIGSCWILFGGYVISGFSPQWPGVAIFLQNIFIFLSSISFKFGRVEE